MTIELLVTVSNDLGAILAAIAGVCAAVFVAWSLLICILFRVKFGRWPELQQPSNQTMRRAGEKRLVPVDDAEGALRHEHRSSRSQPGTDAQVINGRMTNHYNDVHMPQVGVTRSP
jgi:hypothetical protein